MQAVRAWRKIILAAELRTTNPRCQGEAEVLDLQLAEDPLLQVVEQRKAPLKRYPNGSYRACSSDRRWGL